MDNVWLKVRIWYIQRDYYLKAFGIGALLLLRMFVIGITAPLWILPWVCIQLGKDWMVYH